MPKTKYYLVKYHDTTGRVNYQKIIADTDNLMSEFAHPKHDEWRIKYGTQFNIEPISRDEAIRLYRTTGYQRITACPNELRLRKKLVTSLTSYETKWPD